jgi:hypothetical protein
MSNKKPRFISKGGRKNTRHLLPMGKLRESSLQSEPVSNPLKEYFEQTDFSSGFFLHIGKDGITFGPYDSLTDQNFDVCNELD